MSTDKEEKHTKLWEPLPWTYMNQEDINPAYVVGEFNDIVAAIQRCPSNDQGTDLAAFIVRACNNHEKLCEMLELAYDWLDDSCNEHSEAYKTEEGLAVAAKIQAAIKKAKGKL